MNYFLYKTDLVKKKELCIKRKCFCIKHFLTLFNILHLFKILYRAYE